MNINGIPEESTYLNDNFYEYQGYKIFPRLNLHNYYIQIGNSKTKVERKSDNCIYCGSHFKHGKVYHAHLIPELFGQNKSRNGYECNDCNKLSGKWETSLGTFTLPLRIVGKVKNKRGKIPKFKSRLDEYGSETTIYFDEQDVMRCKLGTMDDYLIGDNGTEAKLRFRVGRFNPYDVYKAFLKVAISLMPDDILRKEKWMIEYLFSKERDNSIFAMMYLIYIDNKVVQEPFFELRSYNSEMKNHPQYILVAYFGKSIVHLTLPMKNPEKEVFVQLPPFMNILGARKTYKFEVIDLTESMTEKRDWVFDVSTHN